MEYISHQNISSALETLRKFGLNVEAYQMPISDIVLPECGNKVISVSEDNVIKIWEMPSMRIVGAITNLKDKGLLKITSAENYLFVYYNSSIILFDLQTLIPIKNFDYKGTIHNLRVFKETMQMYVFNYDNVKIINYKTGIECKTISIMDPYTNITISNDQNYICLIKCYYYTKVLCLKYNPRFLEDNLKIYNACTSIFSQNNLYLFIGTSKNQILEYHTETQTIHIIIDEFYAIHSFDCSIDKNLLLISSKSNTITIYDYEKKCEELPIKYRKSNIRFAKISKDMKYIVAASRKKLKIWSYPERQMYESCKFHNHKVQKVIITPNKKFIITGSQDKIIIWDCNTKTYIKAFQDYTGYLGSMSISNDGKILAYGCGDKNIYLVNLDTLETSQLISGHSSGVLKICIDSKYDYILSYEYNGIMRCGQISNSKKERYWGMKLKDCIEMKSYSKKYFITVHTSYFMLWKLENII